jgi:putative ABC transport system permease protein
MYWATNIKTAVESLRQSKWRSLLTMLGVVIGVTSVTTIVSLGEGLKHQISSQIDQLGSDVITVRSGKLVNRSSGDIKDINLLAFLNTSTLTYDDVQALADLESLDGVAPINFVTSSAKTEDASSDNLFVVGTTPDFTNVLRQKIEFGTFFSQDGSDEHYAVIGSSVADNLFGEVNPVGRSITIEGQDFIVEGILKPATQGLLTVAQIDFNTAVFIPNRAAISLTEGKMNILQILVKSNGDDLDTVVSDVRKALLKSHNDQENFTVLKQEELLSIANSTVNIIASFISGIAAITLLVGGISIMDIMWVSVSERTREIGIRKAVGATNRQILSQFLMEGSALSIAGGIIGIVIAVIINILLKVYTDFDPIITIPIILIAVFVSVALGIIFSVAPALKAARKSPIDALRGE